MKERIAIVGSGLVGGGWALAAICDNVHDLADRRRWRDRRLMALAAHHREVANAEAPGPGRDDPGKERG